jgi:esterase/lipase superfamily enzyme
MLPMLAAPPSAGQTLDTTESLKLTASDVVEAQQFGWSVAISDTTAIIGATGDNDNGSGSGSVYLFDTTTGLQIAKLTASDAAAGDNFGRSVAISGNTAIIGAPFDDDAGVSSGSAYLFDTTTGVEIAKLTASDAAAGDLFGFSVAISGTTAIVGAWGDGDAGFNTGSAYLFDTTTGVQIAKLTASDFAGFDSFGYSVAISGTTAVVGAFGNDDAGSNSGSAYLFDTTTGVQVAKLTASDAASGDNFGRSVAISGNTAIVGAPFDDDAGFSSGSAYLFDTTTGVEVAKLTASDATGGAENVEWAESQWCCLRLRHDQRRGTRQTDRIRCCGERLLRLDCGHLRWHSHHRGVR